MKLPNVFVCLGIFLAIFSLQGCGSFHSTQSLPAVGSPAPNKVDATLGFDSVTRLVLANNCVGCHSNQHASKGINLQDLAMIQRPDVIDAIQTQVATDQMPLKGAPLSKLDREILNNWLNAGAPEESAMPIPSDDTVAE